VLQASVAAALGLPAGGVVVLNYVPQTFGGARALAAGARGAQATVGMQVVFSVNAAAALAAPSFAALGLGGGATAAQVAAALDTLLDAAAASKALLAGFAAPGAAAPLAALGYSAAELAAGPAVRLKSSFAVAIASPSATMSPYVAAAPVSAAESATAASGLPQWALGLIIGAAVVGALFAAVMGCICHSRGAKATAADLDCLPTVGEPGKEGAAPAGAAAALELRATEDAEAAGVELEVADAPAAGAAPAGAAGAAPKAAGTKVPKAVDQNIYGNI